MKKINNSGRAMKGIILGLCSLFVCGQLAAMRPEQGGQGGSANPAARVRADQLVAPPGAEASMTAIRAVETWVRAWRVPAQADAHALAPTTAVCITLRLNGEVIARAEVVSSARAERAADQTDLVRCAAASALEEATPRLNVPNDAMRDAAIRELAKNITISLELAGPFTLTEPDTWGDVDGTWKPGLDGVAVQARGAADTALAAPPVVAFPSTMLAANMIPSRAMSSVVARVIGEGGAAAALEEPKKLRAERGLKMYRFRVTHLSQSRADAPSEFLHRGARLIPAGATMTVGEMREMGARLAGHLNGRASGTDADAERVAAYALARWDAFRAERSSQNDAVVMKVVNDLQSVSAPEVKVFARGASSEVRALFAATPGERLVAILPWLGWAELRLLKPEEPILSAIALRAVRAQCWQHQFSLADAGGPAGDDADMIGGIVFTAPVAEGRSSPYPSWPSVRPLAFIATMLGDARLTEPAERPREIVRLMGALRFLRQLQVDESSAWMYANPSAAIGGIRASVWDSSQPVEASALTLLCIVETLKSLEALAAPPPKPIAPGANPPPAK